MAKIEKNLDKVVDTNLNRVIDTNNAEIDIQQANSVEIERLKDVQVAKEAEIDSLKSIQQANIVEIEKLKGVQVAKEAEIDSLKSIQQANIVEIERLKGVQVAKEVEIDSLKSIQQANNIEIDRLNGLLQAKEAEIDSLKNVEQGNKAIISRSIKNVYQNITDQFAGIENIAGGYKLSNVSLDLKVLVDNNLNVRLIDDDPTRRINGATVSSMKVDFARQLQETTTDITGIPMPNVVGLTENACRQVLTSIGLKLDPVYQFGVKNIPVGQAFRQSVVQGTMVSANDLVTVIFAK